MSDSKETFLDSKTVLAIFMVIVCWLLWDHYMRTKYPGKALDKPSSRQSFEKKVEPSQALQVNNFREDVPEQILEFKGENMDIMFSSQGFGIQKLILRKYYNRQKEPIVFKPSKKALFASAFLEDPETVLPFQIKKEGRLFVGVFSFSEGTITKTFRVDDKHFTLNSKIEFEPVEGGKIQGLSLFFSHPILPHKDSGFLKMFFLPVPDIFKGFVVYDTHRHEKFIREDLDSVQSYSRLKVLALGGKYFGKALINQSDLFPSAVITKDDTQVQAQVNYEFLHSKAQQLNYQIFLGPRSFQSLKGLGKDMKNWLDFGFFGWIARPLLVFLTWLYGWCHNWGVSIVLLTFVIRLVLLPLNINAYKSQKIMQIIQPQIQAIKEKYKSDPKTMNLEVMSLMKQNKVNPFGACLPMLLQFPIFLAFYSVLRESVELYQSPFIFWIKDLSLKDPYYVLPILGGVVFFLQQKLFPMTTLSKAHSRVFMILALLFPVFLLNLPSGLTLYMFVTYIFGFIQQFFFVKVGRSFGK